MVLRVELKWSRCHVRLYSATMWLSFMSGNPERNLRASEGGEQLRDHPAGKENGLTYGQLDLY